MKKSTDYNLLNAQVASIIEHESDLIANMANISAILFTTLSDINWAGFYLYKQQQLVLGPFQGNPACVRIPMGKGVCGTAAALKRIQRIDDVHQFDGHIACDAASNSEIVVPIVHQGSLVGVLDIDSPVFSRFSDADEKGLSKTVELLIKTLL